MSDRHGSPRLSGHLTPAVARSGEPTVLNLSITVEAGEGPPRPVDLYVARVAPPAPAVTAALEAGLRGLPVTTLTPEGPRSGCRFSGPGFSTQRAALEALLDRPHADANPGHMLLVVGGIGLEAPEPVLDAAAALAERGWGVDLVVTHAAAELSLLGQVAAVGRGEILFQERLDEDALAARVRDLRSQTVSSPLLDLTVAPGLEAGRIFRSEPSPVLLGVPRLTASDRRIILDAGPLSRGSRASWVFDLQAPPRPAGSYRLMDVSLRYRDARGAGVCRVEIVLDCVDAPWAGRVVHVPTTHLRNRVDLVGECENIAGAYHRGDGRRVAVGLSTLVRRLLAQGQDGLVERTFALRLAFLRSGTLDRVEFNRLRRAVERV